MTAENAPPLVSVIMAVRNEAAYLEETLDSVFAQDYPGEMEVIAADGGSDDGTREILERRAEREPRLRVVDNPDRSAAAGLNRALAAGRGEVVVRCDGRSRLPADYVRLATAILAETGAANVGGRQEARGDSPLTEAAAIALTSPFGMGPSRFRYGTRPGPADTVYLGAFRRSALREAGGFDPQLDRNQDYELNYRLRRAGGTVWFDPRLRAAYLPRRTLGGLWRQFFDYGRGKRAVLRRHPRSLALRQLAPPLLAAGLLASALLPFFGAGWRAAALPGLYIGFLAVTAGVETVRRRTRRGWLLPVVWAVMHVGWGTGFLFGPARISPK